MSVEIFFSNFEFIYKSYAHLKETFESGFVTDHNLARSIIDKIQPFVNYDSFVINLIFVKITYCYPMILMIPPNDTMILVGTGRIITSIWT